MSLPIVQLILIRGYTEAYYQLSDEEQEKLWTQVYNVITASGAKAIGPNTTHAGRTTPMQSFSCWSIRRLKQPSPTPVV